MVGNSRNCGRKLLGRIPASLLPICVALGKNLISHSLHFCCKTKKITVSASRPAASPAFCSTFCGDRRKTKSLEPCL